MVPLKNLSNFWRSLEMSLINSEINLIRTWSKSCAIVSITAANQETTFAEIHKQINKLFVLWFANGDDRTVYIKRYFPTVEIKDYNVMIDGENFFDQSVKNY